MHSAHTQFQRSCGSGPLSDDDHTVWLEALAGGYELYNEGDWEDEIKYAQDPKVQEFSAFLAKQLSTEALPYNRAELIATTNSHLQIHQELRERQDTVDSASLGDWGWLAENDTAVPKDDQPLEVYEYSLEDRTAPVMPDLLSLSPDLLRQMLAHTIAKPLVRNAEAREQYKVRLRPTPSLQSVSPSFT